MPIEKTSELAGQVADRRGGRVVGVVTLLLLAPITAELLQAYLGDLGGVGGLAFAVLFFAPLYGGAGLLIREVSVRTGRGWRCRLLLAAAFGLAMTSVIDGSILTPERADIDDWSTIIGAAEVGGLGMFALLSWVLGHVVMSIAVPTIVAEGLARRTGPWLGWFGLLVTVVGFLGVATLVHRDQWGQAWAVHSSVTTYAVSGLAVVGLIGLAFTRWGAPLAVARDPGRRPPAPWVCALVGAAGMLGFDLAPLSWVGVVVILATALVVGGLVLRWSRLAGWGSRQVLALAYAALVVRLVIGMLAPLPQGTTWTAKILQHAIYTVVVLALGLLLANRTAPAEVERAHSGS